jgi:exonuclease III
LICGAHQRAAQGQLRIVDYNTTGIPNSSAMQTVLAAISNESINGVVEPIDVIVLQELGTGDINTMTSLLNGLGVGTYVASSVGGTTGAGGVGLVYRTQSVDLIEQLQIIDQDTNGAERGVQRFALRPDGYDSAADFYIYGSHYKSSDSSSDRAQRALEATAIRADSDLVLGQGAHVIYTGDFNVYRSTELMWTTLTGGGNGQAFDPVNQVGTWHDNPAFIAVHTQNPAGTGFVGGGMDDRFDWQLVTGELLDHEGMSLLAGSYHAFGNNGTHTINGHINTGTGATPAVLNALGATSDHLPVVAQYQVPAILSAVADVFPATFYVNDMFDLSVLVSNAANVLTSIGADELDYMLTTSGDVFGSFSDMDFALGGGNTHFVTFDTSSPGLKAGLIEISSTSQGVANGLVQIPVSFEVFAIPEPASALLLLLGVPGWLAVVRRQRVAKPGC